MAEFIRALAMQFPHPVTLQERMAQQRTILKRLWAEFDAGVTTDVVTQLADIYREVHPHA
jgi:hypothetical protein